MTTYFSRLQSSARPENTKIRQIPHFMNPEKISQLNFSHNDIRLIPPHISCLFNLQIIDLSHNKISKIDNIYRIPTLKLLNLSHNLITYVPEQISLLEEIENIDLSYNRITMIHNIHILKEFVEMRVIIRQGFVQINLEGNEVLKKKGCREMYKKWMNPNYSDCNQHSQAKIQIKEHQINLTKKRHSKSLQYTHTFRNHNNSSIISTNRTFKVVHPPSQQPNFHSALKNNHRLDSTEKININNIKSEEFSIEKQQYKNTLSLAPTKSEILKKQLGVNLLSEMSQEMGVGQVGNLGEWFCVCIDKLNELKQGFILISQNQDIRGFDFQVKQKLVDECLYARQLISISLEIIRSTIDNRLSREAFQQYIGLIQIINQKIRKYHHEILIAFRQKEHLPLKFYKPWVIYVKKLKQIIQVLPLKITYHQANYARQQQIKQLSSISPQKDITGHSQWQSVNEILSNRKRAGKLDKGKLNDLLFSKSKDELLLSMQKSHRSSQKMKKSQIGEGQIKTSEECDYCLMLKWENHKHKLQIADLQEKVKSFQKQKESSLQKIQGLEKFKEKYLNLICKQELIIQQLQELRPSTYQNILLEQAKTIQYMLSAQQILPLNMKNKAIGYGEHHQKYAIESYTSRQMQKGKLAYTNTHLSSSLANKDKNLKGNPVSEFSIEGKNQLITKESNHRSSYFKNKNIITTVNRTMDEPKSKELTGEANRYQSGQNRNRQQIIVSQFNTQVNHSVYETQSIDRNNNKDNSKDKKYVKELKNSENNDKNAMLYSMSSIHSDLLKNQIAPRIQNAQNQRILISETSQNKNQSRLIIERPKNKQQQSIRLQLLSKLLAAKLNTQKSAHSLKQNIPNSRNSISKKASNKSSSIKQSNHRNVSSYQSKQNNNSQNLHSYKTDNKSYELLRQRHDNFNQGHHYVPMPCRQADNYKQYMKYHLRNNIIEVLTKKNNFLPQYSSQYKYLTKSHQVINKSNNHKKEAYQMQPSQGYSGVKTLR